MTWSLFVLVKNIHYFRKNIVKIEKAWSTYKPHFTSHASYRNWVKQLLWFHHLSFVFQSYKLTQESHIRLRSRMASWKPFDIHHMLPYSPCPSLIHVSPSQDRYPCNTIDGCGGGKIIWKNPKFIVRRLIQSKTFQFGQFSHESFEEFYYVVISRPILAGNRCRGAKRSALIWLPR